VIGLSAIECRSGDSLALEQVVAQTKEQVLNSLDAATTKLRGKLGESLSTKMPIPTSLSSGRQRPSTQSSLNDDPALGPEAPNPGFRSGGYSNIRPRPPHPI
jgi:hypothetical protein